MVNQYLGMRGYLRWIEAWLDYPTPDDAINTQLWHRDFDEYRSIEDVYSVSNQLITVDLCRYSNTTVQRKC